MKRAKKQSSRFRERPFFDRVAAVVTHIAGLPVTSIIAFLLVVAWAVSGPFFGFSDTWQLVINTSTTIITFLMVFVIQQTQNKDTMALQLKLNELIACNEKASNRLIDIEDLTEEELQFAKKFYVRLAKLAEKENDLFGTHSLDDAAEMHSEKQKTVGSRKRNSSTRKTGSANGSN